MFSVISAATLMPRLAMRHDPFGSPMAATVSASRGSARRPVRNSNFLISHVSRASTASSRRRRLRSSPPRDSTGGRGASTGSMAENRADRPAQPHRRHPAPARKAARARRLSQRSGRRSRPWRGAQPTPSAATRHDFDQHHRRAAQPLGEPRRQAVGRRLPVAGDGGIAVGELQRQPHGDARFARSPGVSRQASRPAAGARAWRTASCPTGAWRAWPCGGPPPARICARSARSAPHRQRRRRPGRSRSQPAPVRRFSEWS